MNGCRDIQLPILLGNSYNLCSSTVLMGLEQRFPKFRSEHIHRRSWVGPCLLVPNQRHWEGLEVILGWCRAGNPLHWHLWACKSIQKLSFLDATSVLTGSHCRCFWWPLWGLQRPVEHDAGMGKLEEVPSPVWLHQKEHPGQEKLGYSTKKLGNLV